MNEPRLAAVIPEQSRQRELARFWTRVALEVARKGGPIQEPARRAHEAWRQASRMNG